MKLEESDYLVEQEEESQVSNSDESSIFFLGSKNSVSPVTFMNTEIR